MIEPLLLTKLTIPSVRAALVPRTHLLDGVLNYKLTLIAAAAGFGKTTLAADWSRGQAEAVCWLSLDPADNDPVRFLSYLVAAIQTRLPAVGQELLAALQSVAPPMPENALTALLNQLVRDPLPLILVLDDYHVIDNQAIHIALTFLLDHLPLHVRLMLLTRSDPPLPLARLRARYELLEIRAQALRFTHSEVQAFLSHLNLPDDSISALETRTEGWIVGLHLAALALSGSDPQAFIASFSGSNRFVLDYLIEEVLTQQPDRIRRFLLQTSLLERFNAELCNVVTSQNDSHDLITYLERHNLFLIALDQERGWYRYHHLFADLLYGWLRTESPGQINGLYQRAAAWHRDQSMPEEAIRYALLAGDYELAEQLISGPAANLMRRGEILIVLNWYRAFPAEFIRTHLRLGLLFGLAFALNGRWSEADTLLSICEQGQPDSFPPGELLLLAYLVSAYRQDGPRLEKLAADAARNPQPDPTTLLILGLIAGLSGDWLSACSRIEQSQAQSERENDRDLALTARFHLCRFEVFHGRLGRAYQHCQRALDDLKTLNPAALPISNFVYSALVRILIEWDELERATQYLSHIIEHAQLTGFVTGTLSSATIMLAELKQAQGDRAAADQLIEEALAHAARHDPPHEMTWLKVYCARLWLVQGQVALAAHWLKSDQPEPETRSLFYPSRILPITRARVLLMQRKADEAAVILQNQLSAPPDLFTVEAFCLLALARQAQSDSVHAQLALEQALKLAEAENRVRVFLDLGAPLSRLLDHHCESHPADQFAQNLRKRLPTEHGPLPEPLSDRELSVLKLIAAGYSNDEIAQTQTLALSTIKWYINTLYGKLQVKTRGQAIARAHALHLLDR